MIPLIEIKITNSQLREAYMAIEFDLPELTFTGDKLKNMKSYYSLLDELRIKLAKKVISNGHKIKPFKLTLKYYEARALHKTMEVLPLQRDAQSFFDQLDQKLA